MKNLIIFIAILVTSCSPSGSEKNQKSDVEATVNLNNSMYLADANLDSCLVTSIEFDTTTELQNLYYEPEESLLDYNIQSVNVSVGSSGTGYLILSKGDRFILCLIDGSENNKIIGVTPIPSLKKDEDFVDSCESNCHSDFLTFGVVRKINDSTVIPLMAWRVNNKKRVIEQINPIAVDCNSAFFTDRD